MDEPCNEPNCPKGADGCCEGCAEAFCWSHLDGYYCFACREIHALDEIEED